MHQLRHYVSHYMYLDKHKQMYNVTNRVQELVTFAGGDGDAVDYFCYCMSPFGSI